MTHKLLTCMLTVVMSLGVLTTLPHRAQAQGPDAGVAAQDAAATSSDDAPVTEGPAPPRRELFSPEHRLEIYDAKKLSYVDAALWQLLFPGLGNIYAKQYFFAGLAFVLVGFTTVFVAYAVRTDQPQFYWYGASTFGLASLGGGVLAMFGVRDYNRDLREGLKVPDAEANGAGVPALGPTLTLRF